MIAVLLMALQQAPPPPRALAITHVSVVPMTHNTVLPDMTVVVRDGRIAALGPAAATTIPRGAAVIDGRGQFLMPGLADMHVHLFADDGAVPDSAAPAELGVMIANGVTVARVMIGTPQHLALRQDVAARRVLGPRLWVASPQLSGEDGEHTYVARTAEEARAAVQRAADAGYDFIKLTNRISRPVYDAIVDAARTRGIPVVGHVDPAVGVRRALETGQQLEHLDGFFEAVLADSAAGMPSVTQMGLFQAASWASLDHIDDRKVAELAALTGRAGAFVGPTHNVFNNAFGVGWSDSAIASWPDLQLWPRARLEGYRRARARYWSAAAAEFRTPERRRRYVAVRHALVKGIHDAGGRILAGSDTPEWFNSYGWGLHRELQELVAAGLTPYQALAAATVHPAAFLRQEREWGTIETGKRADLVLLAGNPLADIRNTERIAGVLVGGRHLPQDSLPGLVARAAQAIAP
jgi:imidazolonepropionase-like amidohydrolase